MVNIIITLDILTISILMGGIITGILNPRDSTLKHKFCWIICSIIIIVLLIIMIYWRLAE